MAIIQLNLMQFYIDLVLCAIIGAGIIIYKFRNFMSNWWNVKRSAGSKILVEVENPVQDYFATGTFDNGYLRYKARKRADNPEPNRMISVDDINAVVYNKFGVKCIRVDDTKNFIRPRRGDKDSSLPAYNAEKMDEAIQTALFKPNPNAKGLFDAKTWQLIVIIGFLIVIVLGIAIMRESFTIDGHLQLVYDGVQNITAALPK